MWIRRIALWMLIIVLLSGCASPGPGPAGWPAIDAEKPSPTPTSTPLPTEPAPATPAPLPDDPGGGTNLTFDDFTVNFYPQNFLVVGDLVSLEVIGPPDADLRGKTLRLSVDGRNLGEAEFVPYGLSNRVQATLLWAWDTSGLEHAEYRLELAIGPDGPRWTVPVVLLPEQALSLEERDAAWQSVESDCCIIHYVSGTDAARDLDELVPLIEAQAQAAAQAMQFDFQAPIVVNLLPRLIGHGGFANQEIFVSYLDDNYAGSDLAQVVLHEMIHVLDRRTGGGFRPSLFAEGLAVYLSGGHYRIETLLPRAAALLDIDEYIPLDELANDFYATQHEAGYLQAAVLTGYLIETYGWEAFTSFYRDLPDPRDQSVAEVIDGGMRQVFGASLAQIEVDFVDMLRGQPENPQVRAEVAGTLAFYDTMRRYQQIFDPAAYFRTAWLLPGPEMRELNVTADYLRRPSTPLSRSLEVRLITASQALLSGDTARLQILLDGLHESLDNAEKAPPLELPEEQGVG